MASDKDEQLCFAVDFDGTLAKYDGWKGPLFIGEPIPAMVARVKKWLDDGHEVVIFTARVGEDSPNLRLQIILAIQSWCQRNIGKILEVTDKKDKRFDCMVDDRALAVERNTGKILGGASDAEEIRK